MQLGLSTGVTLAFDQLGSADALPLVLLHGLSSNRTDYHGVIAHLAGRIERGELQVVAVDLRGHGESSHAAPDGYAAADYAADVAELIDSLKLGPTIVAGHSLGGVVASMLATMRPELVTSLLLEDPPTFEGDADRRAASPAASFFPAIVASVKELRARRADESEYGALALPGSTPEQIARRAWSLSRWDPAAMESAITGRMWVGFDPLAIPSCPVTVLRADPAVGAVFTEDDALEFATAAPHAVIELVPGCGHVIHESPALPQYMSALARHLP